MQRCTALFCHLFIPQPFKQFILFFSLKTFWDDRTDFDYKLDPTLSIFQMATFTGENGRLFRLTIVLSLLIGEGSGCKSAFLAPSGPLRPSKDHMVNEFCITYWKIVFFGIKFAILYRLILNRKNNISTQVIPSWNNSEKTMMSIPDLIDLLTAAVMKRYEGQFEKKQTDVK